MINVFLLILLGISICYYLYSVLKPKLKYPVNCWFCNANQWVPYQQRNAYMCKKCDQYNGFDENGDYNKFIPSQRIETLNTNKSVTKKPVFTTFPSTNGLCNTCNQLQGVIIERLNKFEAVDEARYFDEYEAYKANLNQKYPLCDQCQEFTAQKLQFVNERYLSPDFSHTKTPQRTMFPSSILHQRTPSRAPSVISTFSNAKSVFGGAPQTPSAFSRPNKTPSLFSHAASRAPSVFSQATRAQSLFSEPASSFRSAKAPSVASGFSGKTARSRYPVLHEDDDEEDVVQQLKSKHDHENRRRKLYFASGKATIACNILNLVISASLFMALFDSSQISSDVLIIPMEKALPIPAIHALQLCSEYAPIVGTFAALIFFIGLSNSATRVNFLDLLGSVSWPIFSIFCIFDADRNPDFNLIKMIFAGYLCILSSMILFIPKKRKHQKRPNTIYSAFSVASTPASQCSSRLTASRIQNLSNTSLPEDVPDDLVDAWVQDTQECHTVTRLHDLHL